MRDMQPILKEIEALKQDYMNQLKEKYNGCQRFSFSEINEIEKLPSDIQTDIIELSRKHNITLLQAKECYMALGRSEQTDRFCEILRDNGEFVFRMSLYQHLGEQFKKQSQSLKLFCNNYRKMHKLPLIRKNYKH